MPHALILDDDRYNLGVLKELLSMEQVTYTAFNNSMHIKGFLEQGETVDIAILDLGMPHLNGYQVFDLIRQYPHMAQTPVVACTVHTSETENARTAGFHSFIPKPLNIDKFGDQLRRILDGEAVWQTY